MSYKKYVSDYRLEEYIDDRGRIKTKAVYKGDYYTIKPEPSAEDKRFIAAVSAISWIAYITALMQETGAARQIYVTVPFVITAFPLLFMTMAAVSLQGTKALMTRERADKTAGRLPVNSAIAAIISIIAAISFITAVIISSKTPQNIQTGDIIYGISSFITAICAVLIYRKCRMLKAEIIKPAADVKTD